MKLQDLSTADKYLLLGNLLKKINSVRSGEEALDVIRSAETVDTKLAAILEIYRAQGGAEQVPAPGDRGSTAASARSPQRIKSGKPRVLVIDPRTEIPRILTGSHFSKDYAVMHVRKAPRSMAGIWRCSPNVLVVNTEGDIREKLRFCRRLTETKPEVGVVLLCSKAQLRAPEARAASAQGLRILTKPLNLMRMGDVLGELTG